MATLQEIAEYVGVSRMAVSLALRNQPGVSDTTRHQIAAAARKLGYRPNAAARATRDGRFGNIGLLLGTHYGLSNLSDRLLQGVDEALAERGNNLLVTRLPDAKLTSAHYVPRILRERCTDGLLINYTAKIPSQMIELIEQHSVPATWLNIKRDHDAVYPDEWNAAYAITRRMLDMGHRDIAYLDFSASKDRHWHYSGRDRQAGYRQAMLELGIPARRLGSAALRGANRMVQAIRQLLESADNPPTAVLCYNPVEARAAIAAAYQAGREIPRDLSVVCFATHTFQDIGPRVSTMLIPDVEMGHGAVDMLMKRIEQPEQPQASRSIPFEFRPEATLTPPRKP